VSGHRPGYRARRIAEARTGAREVSHCTESAYNYDGCRCECCKFAHSCALALKRARRRLAHGCPVSALSAWEQETVEDELAYREGRIFYRAAGDRVVSAIIPRWVPDGFFAPRRTVLEQLAAAAANGEA
jgi:hypothetical protein